MTETADGFDHQQHLRPATRSTKTPLTITNLPIRTRSAMTQDSSSIDCILAPRPFSGANEENVVDWAKYFARYTAYKGLKEVQTAALIPLLLKGAASYWYDQQEDGVKKDAERLLDALQKHFSPAQST